MNAREAAYLALLSSLRQEKFIKTFLEQWKSEHHPIQKDFAFAYELASGACRMALALDFIATCLSKHGKLALKLKEKALMRIALYQFYFMDKVPPYAIVNESVLIAKKYCHQTFAQYLNAALRKLETLSEKPSLPISMHPKDLSIHYSYPELFVKYLIQERGLEKALEILEVGNKIPSTMARNRIVEEDSSENVISISSKDLDKFTTSSQYYVQNATPAALVLELAKHSPTPHRVLDLCASPGGKLLAVHDYFPKAKLYANDLSSEKLVRIQENLLKYQVEAQLSIGPGEKYQTTEPFDIVILDVPCSNSGVLNKRSEARWRLTPDVLNQLKLTQWNLLKNASTLISKQGVIWYMTCSILKEENEQLVTEFCEKFSHQILYMNTILPNSKGWDGGFACLLK